MLYTHRHSPLYEASAMGQDGNPQRHIRFGAFELDLDTGDLRKGGRAARLQRQPAKVLATLASQPGKLVTREEIRRQIWNGTTFVDFDQSLNFCIRQIRLALDDDRGAPQFVETVPRRGYRFIAPVVPVSVPATVGKEKKKRGLIRNSGLMLGIGLAVVLVGALAYRWKRPHRVSPSEWVQLTDFTDSATSPEFSADGRMLAFLRGPDTFNGPGQVYVKMLPDGEAVQLTHDSLLKNESGILSRRFAHRVHHRGEMGHVGSSNAGRRATVDADQRFRADLDWQPPCALLGNQERPPYGSRGGQ
jgi:DNA-binding winged helix-turn-helix (wHTH) protein